MAFQVVAYYAEWSRYRPDVAQYCVSDMGPCHIAIYSFASMDPSTFEIISGDPVAEKDNYSEFIKYCRSSGRKPILAVGGWVDSTDKYSSMLTVPQHRSRFIASTIQVLKDYGFEGINLDIEYPTCLQADFKNGNMAERDGFVQLIREMKREFAHHHLQLSACIPGSAEIIDRAYDIKEMSQNLDWIGVMTYDYNNSLMQKTGPISSLADTKRTIDHIVKKGADRKKLIVGIPFYGHRYSLSSSQKPSYGAASSGSGPAGPFTREKGFLAYYEICQLVNNHGYIWEENEDGACAYKGNDFISFNSEKDITMKIDLVKDYDLGGVMIWESSMDDFSGNFCSKGENPLMQFIWDNLCDFS